MKAYLNYLKQWLLYFNQRPALFHLRHLYQRYKPHKLISLTQLTSLTQLHKLHELQKLLPSEQRHIINLGHPERIAILLVGLGGTGGWVAHSLAQLAVWARTQGQDLRLAFIDYDSVEPKESSINKFAH